MMFALGGYYFSVETAAPEELDHLRAWNWVESEVINQAPDLQFTGAEAETITLEGTIYPQYKGGFWQMEALSLLAGRGVPMLLVDGTGMVLGFWVIVSIEQKKRKFINNGQPRKIQFYIHLKRFGSMKKALEMLAANPLSALGITDPSSLNPSNLSLGSVGL